MRLDSNGVVPSGMRVYLELYGWHFSKKMCEWAICNFKNKLSKEEVDSLLEKNGIGLKERIGHDYVYVANMAKSDYFGSSIQDDKHLAMFIKDYIEDEDGYKELPFTRFYADCIGKGIPIIWEDMI